MYFDEWLGNGYFHHLHVWLRDTLTHLENYVLLLDGDGGYAGEVL